MIRGSLDKIDLLGAIDDNCPTPWDWEAARLRTPCIGVCSTTYGDLVCRGCKRFAHEIVQWNGYDDAQKRVVWSRLLELRAGSAADVFTIADMGLLRQTADRFAVPDRQTLDPVNLACEVLRRLAAADIALTAAGLASDQSARDLVKAIDREFQLRSVAAYERSFRTSLGSLGG